MSSGAFEYVVRWLLQGSDHSLLYVRLYPYLNFIFIGRLPRDLGSEGLRIKLALDLLPVYYRQKSCPENWRKVTKTNKNQRQDNYKPKTRVYGNDVTHGNWTRPKIDLHVLRLTLL